VKKKKSVAKKNKQNPKETSVNLFLNLIIFALVAIIIFMSYSLFLKFSDRFGFNGKQGKKQVASEIIQLEVLNGCGVSGVADRFTDFLREHKFDVVNVGNYVSFNVDETLVIDRIGNMANAKKVAEELGVPRTNVIQQLNDNYFLDVSVIIGKDYYKLKPIKGEE